MSRQTRASVNTCIVLVVSSAGSECHRFWTRRRASCSTAAPAQPLAVFNGARRWRGRSLRLSAACLHAFGFSCSAAASLAESLTRAGKQTSYCNVAAHHQDATDTPARLEYSALACYARRNVVLLQPRSDRARAQIDRIQPRAALRGVFRCVLFQARDVCLVCSPTKASLVMSNPGAIAAATQTPRNPTHR